MRKLLYYIRVYLVWKKFQDGEITYRFNLYNPIGYMLLLIVAIAIGVFELLKTIFDVIVEVIGTSIEAGQEIKGAKKAQK
jgi:uncharacterized membrane protein